MGIFAKQGGSRAGGVSHDNSSSSNGIPVTSKRKWTRLLPLIVVLVVVTEIASLANHAAMVDSLVDFFYRSPPLQEMIEGERKMGVGASVNDGGIRSVSCEEWLEKEDGVVYSRDFKRNPVLVSGGEKDWKYCDVECQFGHDPSQKPDAVLGSPQQGTVASVLRSMESSHYYPENNIATAKRKGYTVVMTTSLSSDVPVVYFSWAEYDIMAPVQPKTEAALAAAFISNCGARNFRLQALDALEKLNVKIDSYGSCHRNRDGRVDKVETLKRYKFSLAFENSDEEDYVTEKFFQSLVAGTIPVVVGAPNIQDFAPSPDSFLHIKEISDAEPVAKTMKYLAENPTLYNQSLRWKYDGPSDSFKALVDMAAVHSSCRLCVHLATLIREREETSTGFKKRPCKCSRGSETVYHLYVRERGRFHMQSIFLRSGNLTMESLESAVLAKFNSSKHVPIWKEERPESLRGGEGLKIYRIYPVGLTQRQALYNFRFKGRNDFRTHVETHPCAKLEVIFV